MYEFEDGHEWDDGSDHQQLSCMNSKKKKTLTTFQVSNIVTVNGLKTVRELQSLVYQQNKEKKTDLAEFLINQSPCVTEDKEMLHER